MKTTVVGSMPSVPPARDMMRSLWDGTDPFIISLVESVRVQVEAGVDIVSDGQTRRGMIELFTIPLAGIRQKARPEIVGDIRRPLPVTVADLEKAKIAARRTWEGLPEDGRSPGPPEVKGIVTGAFTLTRSCVDRHYGDEAEAAMAMADALNPELRDLSSLTGHLQVDEPFFSVEMPEYAAELVARVFDGVEGTRWLHVCGDISPIAGRLADLKVDVLDHEFAAHPEAMGAYGEVEPRQAIGFGAVRSDDPAVETAEEARGLLERGAGLFGEERMFADPDCGLRHMPDGSAAGKLRILVEAARGL